MDKQTILIAIVALLVGSIGGYAIADKEGAQYGRDYKNEVADTVPPGMHRMPDGSLMNHGAPASVEANHMDHMMAMLVSSEREFIEGMIPHHQEAVDTAKEVIARGGTTPEIKQLVEAIVVAQEREITAMKQWYQDWYGEGYVDTGTYQPMMRELENLSGAELDRVFLEDMIMHHMGAIMMARSVQPYIEHEALAELTQAIVSTQAAEIAEMRGLLRAL